MKKKLTPIQYRDPSDKKAPHFISFSGGRSSAALTFMALEEGLLIPERGDAILFANTSAEHPKTYDFTAECKRRIESEYNIPFFWYEFCTVEDAWQGEYRRKATYRLVKPVPFERSKYGYRSGGELFEEFVNLQGMLPNPHSRTCTAKLKLFPAHELLGEWLGGMAGPAAKGSHFRNMEFAKGEKLDADAYAEKYKRNGGTAPIEVARARMEYLYNLPPFRPAQKWEKYTTADIVETQLNSGKRNPQAAPMRGAEAPIHVRFLGLRGDEAKRVDRVLSRSMFAEGAKSAACTIQTQPPGERPYFPLFDSQISDEDIRAYWKQMDFDLEIPEGAGNCTFCFMKGSNNLVTLGNTIPVRKRNKLKPDNVEWWADFEKRHMRTAPRRGATDEVSSFGFFGVNALTFQDIAEGKNTGGRYAKGTPACDCTD